MESWASGHLSLKNRHSARARITKPISVGKQEYLNMLICKVLPAIREKWPGDEAGRPIYLQQDNAKPHTRPDNAIFMTAAKTTGFDVQLRYQPPNSPDMKVLDLGYFNAIQSLQHLRGPKTVDDLIVDVEESFSSLEPAKLNRVFLSWQQCMISCMTFGGGNNYQLPHMSKQRLEREGIFPISLNVDRAIIDQVSLLLD